MPSPLKNNLVLKASNVEIVAKWWLTPRWHLLEVYLSIGLTLPRWCANKDDASTGPILLVVETIWNFFIQLRETSFSLALSSNHLLKQET
jgi:hypothetical protein